MLQKLFENRKLLGEGSCLGCVVKTGAADGKVENCIWFALVSMSKSNPFKWRHYKPKIILLRVRWYLSYPLSYRQVAEMVNERGLEIHHVTAGVWARVVPYK